jgi:hypothetical protein
MRCDHEHDDGAYVLGALSPSERAAYERHLSTCSFCREAVAEIAVLPGLLGRLDPADFAKLLDPTLSPAAPAPRNRTPDLVSAAQSTRRKERKKTRVRVLSTALAAAVVALVVGVGAVFWLGSGGSGPAGSGRMVAMTAVASQVPVSAKVRVTGLNAGTQVDLVCAYNNSSPELEPYTIWLKAEGPDGETDAMGSWVAAPGKEFRMSGTTHFVGAGLSRLVLMRSDGKVLLAYDVP